jgi:hypothetical protein
MGNILQLAIMKKGGIYPPFFMAQLSCSYSGGACVNAVWARVLA